MRIAFRQIVTLLAVVLGAGTLSPLVQANWQAWAQKTGHDQYFIRYADMAMSSVANLAQSPWFIFIAGFFIGGAVCLWLDYLLRQRPTNTAVATSAPDLAHGLTPIGTRGVVVIVDHKKKVVQIAFNLKNNTALALRYVVKDATSAVDGHTSMKQNFTNRGGVVVKDGETQFKCVPIPYAVTKKGAEATASITYEYGLAAPDQPTVREGVYRFEINIQPNGASAYIIAKENDAEI